jgi:hypothetical protein
MDEMKEFTDLAEANFITAKGMIIIALTVEIIVQTFALIVHPTDWWTWQLLGFITATNLGALILGIVAQRSAEQLSKTCKQVFTPDFYFTVKTLTDFRKIMQAEAEKEGRNMTEEWAELAPKIYGVARKWLDVRYAQDLKIPPDLKDLGIVLEEGFNPESVSDEELFNP